MPDALLSTILAPALSSSRWLGPKVQLARAAWKWDHRPHQISPAGQNRLDGILQIFSGWCSKRGPHNTTIFYVDMHNKAVSPYYWNSECWTYMICVSWELNPDPISCGKILVLSKDLFTSKVWRSILLPEKLSCDDARANKPPQYSKHILLQVMSLQEWLKQRLITARLRKSGWRYIWCVCTMYQQGILENLGTDDVVWQI